MHCILFKKLGSSFPLLMPANDSTLRVYGNWIFTPFILPFAPPLSRSEGCLLRNCFLKALKSILRNDELAAEYVLLSCMSHVYGHRHGAAPLGYLSTNIRGIDTSAESDAMVSSIIEIVSSVVPLAESIDVSKRSDLHAEYDENRGTLSISPLQLAEGTVLCVDERRLTDIRNLSQSHKKSLSTLDSVIEKLTLPLIASYYSVDLPLDISTLIFSQAESIFHPQLVCPWEPQEASGLELQSSLSDFQNSLSLIRLWWSYTRLRNVVMSAAAITVAENDFVNLRQVDSRLTLEDFHTWLCVARLIAISYGDSEITPEHWNLMRSMERKRLNRLVPIPETTRLNDPTSIFQRASPNTVAAGL